MCQCIAVVAFVIVIIITVPFHRCPSLKLGVAFVAIKKFFMMLF